VTVEQFQSPIHRVNGCNQNVDNKRANLARVSVPYSSGQWLQPEKDFKLASVGLLFQSPIHRVNGCNGVQRCTEQIEITGFSPLFIGSMAATSGAVIQTITAARFQSPIHRVNGCNNVSKFMTEWAGRGFSPLFIGSMAATWKCK